MSGTRWCTFLVLCSIGLFLGVDHLHGCLGCHRLEWSLLMVMRVWNSCTRNSLHSFYGPKQFLKENR